MPSLRTALPHELADNVIRQHNTQLLVDLARQQLRQHMHETDPEKIRKPEDDTARGLINYILYESGKMTGRKFSKGS